MSNRIFAVTKKHSKGFIIGFYGSLVSQLLVDQFSTYYLLFLTSKQAPDDIEVIPEGLISSAALGKIF